MESPLDDQSTILHHEEPEEGEAWLVSYADMMTLLFGFFVLMYSFAAAKVDETSDDWVKVKREVSAYFGAQTSDSQESANGPTGSTDKGQAPNSASSQTATSAAEGRPDTAPGRDSAADIPAVPFDSKFRFLATRDEISDEVATLLASLADRASIEPSRLEQLRGQVEVEVLKGLLSSISGTEGSQAPDPTGATNQAGSGIQSIRLVVDRRKLLGMGQLEGTVTAEGKDMLRQLAQKLVSFKRPLDVSVESFISATGNRVGSANNDLSKSFATSAQRAALLMQALYGEMRLLSPNDDSVDHIFRSSAMGRFEGTHQISGSLLDPIVFRIAIIER